MNNGEKADLMAALEKAAAESFNSLKYITREPWVNNDQSAARFGALTPRVAYILGWDSQRVLRGLKAAVKTGKVIQSGPSYKYGMASYWPVGLFDKLREHAMCEVAKKPEGGA